MKGKLIISGLLFSLLATPAFADVYVVIYATHNGKTGHAGIAIDKYEVKVRDCNTCPGKVKYDTVRTGNLLYYDMWPEADHFSKQRLFEAVPAVYYRLPASSAEASITPQSLMSKGIPHQEGYACDGLLRFKTSCGSDADLVAYLDKFIEKRKTFQAVDFNCADFVEIAVEHFLGKNIDADEYVMLTYYATTPNQLYKTLVKLPAVTVLKNPGESINPSFWEEKIIKW
ncbi:MAG: hypothetical protein IPL65_11015 [Lewinellaceae bacterium]|nr:hypothetical protein [Lewinellaceae bacterium]